MRKKIIILGVVLALVTGCKKETPEQTNDNVSEEVIETVETDENTSNTENENSETQESEDNTVKEDNTTSNKTETETETATNDTKVTLGENEYIRVEDNTVHKYTFTYPDKETCVKKGDGEPYEILYPIRPYAVFGCEEIKDADGNILWGEFFYEEPSEEYIFYY